MIFSENRPPLCANAALRVRIMRETTRKLLANFADPSNPNPSATAAFRADWAITFANKTCLDHDVSYLGQGMKPRLWAGGLILAAQIWAGMGAFAGPWEDGMAAYNRGDYVPAIQVFRAMAQQGNADAQSLLGTMYRKGQGVTRSSVRAFVWFSRAAAHGNAKAKTELRAVSQAMTPEELAQARELAEACEASNYRTCEY